LALASDNVEAAVAVEVADLDVEGGIGDGGDQAVDLGEHAEAIVVVDALAGAEGTDNQVEIAVVVVIEELAVVVVDRAVGNDLAADVGICAAAVVAKEEFGAATGQGVHAEHVDVAVAVDIAEVVGIAGTVGGHAAGDVGEDAGAIVAVELALAGAAGDAQVEIEVAVHVPEDAVHGRGDGLVGHVGIGDIGEVAGAI